MRVLVCGSRKWEDYDAIEKRLKLLSKHTVIIEGEAPGADRMARRIAQRLGMVVAPFPAHWDEFGPAAGPIRNQQMLDEGKPNLVLAFGLPGGTGTKDMVARARNAGIPVEELGAS